MKSLLFVTAIMSMIAGPTLAGDWKLDSTASKIAFASIKNDYVGEVHTFKELSGSVSDEGVADIAIDLSSVETLIDIRNERMAEHVFKMLPSARLTAQLDLSEAQKVAVGDMMTMDVEAVLSLVGTEVDVYTEMVMVRLSEDRVMVMSNDMAFLETDTAGIDEGIDKLQELAGLDMIARAVPVTVRFVFDAS